MRPDDFDDFEDEDEPAVRGDGTLTPENKLTLRRMIRSAIRWQNAQTLFTCRQCCFYRPSKVGCSPTSCRCFPSCGLDKKNTLMFAKRMPTQLPECFLFDPLASSFVGVLDFILSLGIDLNAERGWASVVSRIAKRQDRYGYIAGVTQRNLERL